MPELPEVETIARTLAPQVEGKTIAKIHILLPKAAQAGAKLLTGAVPGMRVKRVFRRAKLLMLEMERPAPAKGKPDTLFLAFHLKMTGQFFVHPPQSAPLKHTRLIFDLEPGGSRLFFDDARTFGYCRAMLAEDLPAWAFWAALGPEPLETPALGLAQALIQSKGGKGAIKARLLDQTVIAGCGNIYADESLFEAGIHPKARADSLSPAKAEKLALALQAILQRSIEECGSSIRDYKDSNGNAGAFQNCFKVYGRKGEPCVTCSRPLETEKVAGRTTTFCRKCQKL